MHEDSQVPWAPRPRRLTSFGGGGGTLPRRASAVALLLAALLLLLAVLGPGKRPILPLSLYEAGTSTAAFGGSQHGQGINGMETLRRLRIDDGDLLAMAEKGASPEGNSERSSSEGGGGGSESDDNDGMPHKTSGAFAPIVFFLLAFTISIFCQQFVVALPRWLRPPHSVLLYFMGMLLAFVGESAGESEFGNAVSGFMKVDPEIIFWVFLPMVLYEDASSSPWHVVRRVFPSAIMLAFPGVILNSVLTGGFVNLVTGMEFNSALVLGAILAATDPVAVISSLNALQAPAKLSSIISGEALLNDGSAVVMFEIFIHVASGQSSFQLGTAILKLLRLSLGGVLLGLAVGLVAQAWLRQSRNFSVEMLLVVICVYALFFVAEHEQVKVSGVLAVVSFGFFMSALGKFSLSIENRGDHHAIVEFLALLSNEAIFVVAGVVGYQFSFSNEAITSRDWLDLLLLYLGIHVTRAIVLAVCFPYLHKSGYRLSVKEATICVFAGLRGGVGLAMGLLVLGNPHMDTILKRKIAFHVNGIVLGTLVINGTSITWLYKKLKISSPHRQEHHEVLKRLILERAQHVVTNRSHEIQRNWFFQNADMQAVQDLLPKLTKCMEREHFDFYGRMSHPVLGRKQVKGFVHHLMETAPSSVESHFRDKRRAAEQEECTRNVFRVDFESHEHRRDVKTEEGCTTAVGTFVRKGSRTMIDRMRHNSENSYSERVTFMQEVMAMVTKTTGAQFEAMFSAQSVNRAAYEVLRASVEHQIEAVEGDLADYHFLRDEKPHLHKAETKDQMHEALRVGWLYVKNMLKTTHDPVMNTLMAAVGEHRSRSYDYWITMRNLQILLAYAMTIDDLIGELDEICNELFEANGDAHNAVKDVLIQPMKELLCESRELLEATAREDPALFRICEHMLLAQTILVHETAVLKDLAEEGSLEDCDWQALVKNVILPCRSALAKYVPSAKHLEKGGCPHVRHYSGFVNKLVHILEFFTLESIN